MARTDKDILRVATSFAWNGGVAIDKTRARERRTKVYNKCAGRTLLEIRRARFIGCFSLDVEFE